MKWIDKNKRTMIEKHYYAHGVLDIEATLDVIINHLNALEDKIKEILK